MHHFQQFSRRRDKNAGREAINQMSPAMEELELPWLSRFSTIQALMGKSQTISYPIRLSLEMTESLFSRLCQKISCGWNTCIERNLR